MVVYKAPCDIVVLYIIRLRLVLIYFVVRLQNVGRFTRYAYRVSYSRVNKT